MEEVRISTNGRRSRVDYYEAGELFIETFEESGNHVIRTSFNRAGEVLGREMLPSRSRAHSKLATDFANAKGNPVATEYAEIDVLKPCPKCGGSLAYEDSRADVVLPVLVCGSCRSKSFCLTDEYLAKLVKLNKVLFDDSERKMMDESPDAFKAELRDHIIKIYASKHISKI